MQLQKLQIDNKLSVDLIVDTTIRTTGARSAAQIITAKKGKESPAFFIANVCEGREVSSLDGRKSVLMFVTKNSVAIDQRFQQYNAVSKNKQFEVKRNVQIHSKTCAKGNLQEENFQIKENEQINQEKKKVVVEDGAKLPVDDVEGKEKLDSPQQEFDFDKMKPCEIPLAVPQSWAEFATQKLKLEEILDRIVVAKPNFDVCESILPMIVKKRQLGALSKGFTEAIALSSSILNIEEEETLTERSLCVKRCIFMMYLVNTLNGTVLMSTYKNIKKLLLRYCDKKTNIDFLLNHILREGFNAHKRGDVKAVKAWREGKFFPQISEKPAQKQDADISPERCANGISGGENKFLVATSTSTCTENKQLFVTNSQLEDKASEKSVIDEEIINSCYSYQTDVIQLDKEEKGSEVTETNRNESEKEGAESVFENQCDEESDMGVGESVEENKKVCFMTESEELHSLPIGYSEYEDLVLSGKTEINITKATWIRKKRPSKFKDCTINVGSISFTSSEWDQMLAKNGPKATLDTFYYPSMLVDKIICKYKLGCVLIIRDQRALKKKCYIQIRLYCSHLKCPCKYVVMLFDEPSENSDVNMILLTNTYDTEHGDIGPLSRPCSGVSRKIMKEKLKHNNCQNVINDAVNAADKCVMKRGYAPNVYSDDVMRQIKKEGLAFDSHRMDPDDLISVMKKLNKEHHDEKAYGIPSFIQFLSIPLACDLYSLKQLQILEGLDKRIGYFDATGGICKKMGEREVYYYVIVIHENNKILPIAEFFLGKHDNVSIGAPLERLQYDYQIKHELRGQMFDELVVDFSWAIIRATCRVFNKGMDILNYLEYAMACARGEQKRDKFITHILICCAHIMKKACELAAKTISDKGAKQFCKEVFAKLIDAATLDECKKITRHFFAVLISKKHTPYVARNLNALLQITCKEEIEYEKTYIEEEEEEEEDDLLPAKIFKDGKTLYKNSPFYTLFSHILEEVQDEVKEDGDLHSEEKYSPNKLFGQGFAEAMLRRYLSYLPLINANIIPSKGPKRRVSNAIVERFHKSRKHEIMEKRKRISLDANIELSRKYITAATTKLEFKIRSKRNTKNLTEESKNTDCDPKPKQSTENTWKPECWKRRGTWKNKKSERSHFKANKLKKMKLDTETGGNEQHIQFVPAQESEELKEEELKKFNELGKSVKDQKFDFNDADNFDMEICIDVNTSDSAPAEKQAEWEKVHNTDEFLSAEDYEAYRANEDYEVLSYYSDDDGGNDTLHHSSTSPIPTVSAKIISYNGAKLKTHENGLVAGIPKYYAKVDKRRKNFTVCLFGNTTEILSKNSATKMNCKPNADELKQRQCREVLKISQHFKCFSFSDVVNHNGKLHATTVDMYIILLLQMFDPRERCMAVSVMSTSKFLNARANYNKMDMESKYAIRDAPNKFKKFIVPLLQRSHYVIFIIDNTQKEIRYYNSIKGYFTKKEIEVCAKKLVANFVDQYKELKLTDVAHEYKLITQDCCQQQDSTSCGVAVCYFAEMEIRNKKPDKNYNILAYRSEMAEIILKSSNCVTNLCMVCNKNDEESLRDDTWIQCDKCDRWFHSSCLVVEYKTTFDILSSNPFQCALCSSYFSKNSYL